MTREEAIADIRDNIKPIVGGKSLDMAIQSLTAISELSKSLKAVNRYEMDEKVLIGFNMAVAIFNKCFGESCVLKNEQTELNGDLVKENKDLVKEDVENADKKGIFGETVSQSLVKDGDLISLDVVIEWLKGKDIIKLSSQEETARKELNALSSGELQPYVENMQSVDGDLISRKAVIDIVEFECGEWKGLAKTIVKEIEQLQRAEKTAEWIIGSYEVKCSHCEYLVWGSGLNAYKEWKFCPNCGSRMKGDTE